MKNSQHATKSIESHQPLTPVYVLHQLLEMSYVTSTKDFSFGQ